MFEKSTTKPKHNLLRYINIVKIVTFEVRIVNTIHQIPELTTSAVKHNIDITMVNLI